MSGINSLATNEACLSLDVWTPEITPGAKLPVFVWMHGGGNIQGATDWPPLGITLAEQGVVVVSINYRLGVLGFLASTSLAAESAHRVSGNYGHLDQIAALRWVRENIAHFGGDPARVTIGGQSSGSQDVCNLMASPLAAGLFHQAILHSGFCVDSVFPTVQSAQLKGERLARDLRLPSGPAGLKAMRALPADRILQAADADPTLDIEPVIDGWVFPHQPAIAFQQGNQANIAVLAGSNENEVSIFASPIVSGKSWRPDTIAAYRQRLQTRYGSFADQVFAQYPATSDSDARRAYEKMATDYFYGFGAWLMANEMAKIGQKTFLYRFNYAGSGKFAPLGAFHAEELMFLSNKYWTSWIPTPEDAEMSRAIDGYWTAFLKTGNPNSPGLPAWPAWRPDGMAQSLGPSIAPMPIPRVEHFAVLQQRLSSRLQKLQQ